MSTATLRLSAQTRRVLQTMLEDPSSQYYGLEIMRAAGLKSGTCYPLLARLERAGWISSSWESVDPADAGRPRRRLYRMTAYGHAAASEAIGRERKAAEPTRTRRREQPIPVPA